MSRKLIRMFVAVGALVAASFAYATVEAHGRGGSCRNVAPFCSDECSCGPMRCVADCDVECDESVVPEGSQGYWTVWCEDVIQ